MEEENTTLKELNERLKKRTQATKGELKAIQEKYEKLEAIQ